MARRAGSALPAILAFAAAASGALLIIGTPAAAAAARTASQPPATVAFTGLNPQWASPGATISVTGTVKDTAPVSERLIVQLLDSRTGVTSVAELEQGAAGELYGLAGLPLPSATWTSPLLKPGTSASWSIRVPVATMGFTTFGDYPLAAEVSDTQGLPLNNTLTYLPYMPARSGPYGSSIPAPQKISWVWPLVDQPLLDERWQSACKGPQAAALARSLASGGRLSQLLDAADATAGTAVLQAQAVQAGAGRAAQRLAALTEPAPSLAEDAAATWAVDPALLVNVSDLARCGASEPLWARAASSWLSRLKAETASQPLFATPYGDPNVAALIGAGHAGDVGNAFTYGRRRAGQILGRDLAPSIPGTGAAEQAGLAWSSTGTSYATLENLAEGDGVSTVLIGSSAYPSQQASVLRTLDGGGSYMNVLLSDDSLASLLGSAGSGPGAAFTTAQQFLAETALLAHLNPAAPIIVAPPQRWQPPADLAQAVLSDTASAPWLTPVTLTSLTGAAHIPSVAPPASTDASGLSPLEQDQFGVLDAGVARQQALRAEPDPNLYLAVSTVESSAYSGRFKTAALGMAELVASRMAEQEQRVHIIAENRITLGGTRGSVPVSIDNRLPFPVRVSLQLSYSQADGMRVSASPPGPSTVPAATADGTPGTETVRLRITAAQTGSTTITMTLLNQANQPLATPPVRTTVQTTQVGLLGMTIFGAALGVFLLASAARAIRRGRPRAAQDEALGPAPREDDEPGQSTEEAGPDTVVTGSTGAPPSWTGESAGLQERGELGSAGSPRPR
jgi:hypothetical protein